MHEDNEMGALVIEHFVRKENEGRYQQWLLEVLEASKRFPGYVGREVFPPDGVGKPYVTIVRFETERALRKWLDSPERKALIEQIQGVLESGDKTSVKAGIDVWFPPAKGQGRPPAYKQFLLTAGAIYPLTLVVPWALSPLFGTSALFENPLISGLLITAVIVGLMTYVVMPRLTHWLHEWLFEESAG